MHPAISLPFTLALLLILGLCSFFFSASETSIIGLSKIRLRHMIAKNIKNSAGIQRLLSNSDKFIATILVGNNIANIAMSAIITVITVQVLGFQWGAFISTLVSAFIILIFCEISPKILALKHTEKMALFSAPIMEVSAIAKKNDKTMKKKNNIVKGK